MCIEGLNSKAKLGLYKHLVRKWSSKGISMGLVMLELDSCLNLGQDNIERVSFVLGWELWTENFDAMLALVKEYIIDLWEVRKVKLYGRTMLYPASVSVLSWGFKGWHCGW